MSRYDLALGRKPPKPREQLATSALYAKRKVGRPSAIDQLYEADGETLSNYGKRYMAVMHWMEDLNDKRDFSEV